MEDAQVPQPLTGITPYLSIASRLGREAVDFYARAFGAVDGHAGKAVAIGRGGLQHRFAIVVGDMQEDAVQIISRFFR